jgi:hypothetical protein
MLLHLWQAIGIICLISFFIGIPWLLWEVHKAPLMEECSSCQVPWKPEKIVVKYGMALCPRCLGDLSLAKAEEDFRMRYPSALIPRVIN